MTRNQLFFTLLLFLLPLLASVAEAQGVSVTNTLPRCTTDVRFNIQLPIAGTGIISTIFTSFSNNLNNISANVYTSLIANPSFTLAVRGTMVMFILFYGYQFFYAGARVNAMDMTMRLLKLSVVAYIISPGWWWNPATNSYVLMGPWTFFNVTVVSFFDNSLNELINFMGNISIGQGWVETAPTASFSMFDNILATVLSPKMLVTLVAIVFSGPFGIIFGLIIFIGLGQFMAAMFQAVWVLIMSMVVRTFLFGIAPLFFVFLMFERTRHLFDGWLNQVINACLQPLFLFIFFAFFANLIYASLFIFLSIPACQLPWDCVDGTPETCTIWRLVINGVVPTGTIGFGDNFPIQLASGFIFWLLVHLSWQYQTAALAFASELASASTKLDLSTTLSKGTEGAFSALAGMASGRKPRDTGGSRPTPRAPEVPRPPVVAVPPAGGDGGGGGGGASA